MLLFQLIQRPAEKKPFFLPVIKNKLPAFRADQVYGIRIQKIGFSIPLGGKKDFIPLPFQKAYSREGVSLAICRTAYGSLQSGSTLISTLIKIPPVYVF